MKLGQISAWPPAVRYGDGSTIPGTGTLVRCEFIPGNSRLATRLELTVEHRSKQFEGIYWHTSETILRRIELTLRSRLGITLDNSRDLDLVGFHEDCHRRTEDSWSAETHWLTLARHTPIAILTDLDGTLIPFADRPGQAEVPTMLAELLQALAASPGIQVSVVSGRSRESLERLFPKSPAVWLVAEHGAWRRAEGAWIETAPDSSGNLKELALDLEALAGRTPRVYLERKTLSLALHYRLVASKDRDALLVEASAIIERWLADHPGFERLEGAMVVEIRSARIRKSLAIPWLRERAGFGTRLVVLGDDVTDEDMFRELGPQDEGILVGLERTRTTNAHWAMPGPSEVVEFLKWISAARSPKATPPLKVPPRPVQREAKGKARAPGRLLVVSNRLPDLRVPTGPADASTRVVGGLVSALEPVLRQRDGLWLGWSGRSQGTLLNPVAGIEEEVQPRLAWVDFTPDLHREYYSGFCNRSLWPLFHSFPARVRFTSQEWESYIQGNELFAEAAKGLVRQDAPIWAHDYHLLLLAAALRRRGHRGPIGLFLHIPFPGADLFRMIPWSERLLEDLLAFDLIGFQTGNDVSNFLQTVGFLSPAQVGDDVVQHRGRRIRVRAFPIGIVPEKYIEGSKGEAAQEAEKLIHDAGAVRVIIGVDRLDYTKGIPQRLEAFSRLLELFPEWMGKVAMIQVSVPSRADIPEYREQRSIIEQTVTRINRDFGHPGWTPVRYLYRSFSTSQLVHLYRAGRVAMVTPLRDGMNLVAKEFVAAQDPANPGVLLLSRFAGAAVELRDALLTNPYHIDGMARDLHRALRMPPSERVSRHARLKDAVERTTALTWAEDFVRELCLR